MSHARSTSRMSTVMQLFLCSKVTILILGLILLTTTTSLQPLKEDTEGRSLSLVPQQKSGQYNEVQDEPTSTDQQDLDMQLVNATDHENGGSRVMPKMELESITVTRKLVRSSHLHKTPHSVPAPPAPVVTMDASKAMEKESSVWRRAQMETQKTAAKERSSKADASAAFHADYGGPWTHPPTNN